LSDIWLRLRNNLTPESALFRHAVRMSVVLCAGYAIIQITGLHHGYWILLTSLFVCQPNYNATRHRLTLRIVGTIAGIALGLPVLYFVPSQEGQLILIVVTGVLFSPFVLYNTRRPPCSSPCWCCCALICSAKVLKSPCRE
jgi:uncharacterized membrane protein YccC